MASEHEVRWKWQHPRFGGGADVWACQCSCGVTIAHEDTEKKLLAAHRAHVEEKADG